MCSLCAVLGSSRAWTDAAGRSEFAPAGHRITRRHEREQRVAFLNRVLHYYQLQIQDWGGHSYVVTNAQGKSANVYTLQGVWAAAERLVDGHGCDPLDVELLAALEARDGAR
jgi:hypothetical protein